MRIFGWTHFKRSAYWIVWQLWDVEKALLPTIKLNKGTILFYGSYNTFISSSNFNLTAKCEINL